ncbi:hypothetical protein C8R47DRAFT_408281 [Mycena vitilis]|nr:hypothetical protein C8R47DRAFT_408281 [Mycena vitilis]
MKTSRQAQHTALGNVQVELVGVTTPAAKQLDLKVSVASDGGCRSSATPETVTRVARLVETGGSEPGLESADELRTTKGGGVGFSKEWSSGRKGMNGKKVLHCPHRTCRRGIRRRGDNNGDATTKRIGLGSGDGDLHVPETTFFEEPNRAASKVDRTVKFGPITNGELAASEEAGPSQVLGRIENGIVNDREIASNQPETKENVESYGSLG